MLPNTQSNLNGVDEGVYLASCIECDGLKSDRKNHPFVNALF